MVYKRKYLLIIAILTLLFTIALIWIEHTLLNFLWINEYVHIGVELLGSFTAIAISILLFTEKKRWDWDFSGIIIGFYSMGILDIFHGFCLPGQSFVFLHSLASLFGALGVVVFIITNKYKLRLKLTKLAIFIITLSSIFIGVTSIVYEDKLPIMVLSGEFTLIATMINIIGGILFLLGAWFCYNCLRKKDSILTRLFFVSIFLLGLGGIIFRYSELWSLSWWTWHFIRLIAQLILISYIFIISEENRRIVKNQNAEIKDINQKLNNYTYTISHDLKEPIRSIRTFSEFILEDYGEQFDETASDYFNRIIIASNKMADMIEDLLVLSKVGKDNIEFKEVMLMGLIGEILDDMELAIDESNATIEYNELPIIVCQPVWIKIVLSNLISNSIKYRDETKDNLNILIKSKEYKGNYKITIIDNGIGIDKDQHLKIFGLFRRAYSKKNKTGSGAGLAIVEAIVKQHGGKVWIEQSTLGVGTTISFTIERRK